ncbi:hypothetical protein AAKU52_003431, partial [Pedobacter sp. CG_S7]
FDSIQFLKAKKAGASKIEKLFQFNIVELTPAYAREGNSL